MAGRSGRSTGLAGDHHLFSFDQDYIDDPDRPTLSLSFKGQLGGLVTAVRPVGRRVPPFFSNLLPEGHLRTYLAELAGIKPEREFFLLALLGADLSGASTVTPFTADGHRAEPKEDKQERGSRRDAGVLRFSLAGVQLKFSAVMEASGGLTIPVHGIGGSWIVKLPSPQFPAVAENEYVMLELAGAPLASTCPRSGWFPSVRFRACRNPPPGWEGRHWWSSALTVRLGQSASIWRTLRRFSVCSPMTSTDVEATPTSLRFSGPKRASRARM